MLVLLFEIIVGFMCVLKAGLYKVDHNILTILL